MIRAWIAAAAVALTAGTAAHSQILAEYHPAPLADQIILTNAAECGTGPMELGVYLAGSAGELTVMSEASASTAAADRPVATREGTLEVETTEDAIFLTLADLAPGERIWISVKLESDYDEAEASLFDSAAAMIAGAEAVATAPDGAEWLGLFGETGKASVATNACRL